MVTDENFKAEFQPLVMLSSPSVRLIHNTQYARVADCIDKKIYQLFWLTIAVNLQGIPGLQLVMAQQANCFQGT